MCVFMSTACCVCNTEPERRRILMPPVLFFFSCFACLVSVCEGVHANVFVCVLCVLPSTVHAVPGERGYLKKMDAGERVALWLGCVTICLSSEPVYCCFLHNDPV